MIEILQETKISVVCVKPVGIAAQGTDAQALPQLKSMLVMLWRVVQFFRVLAVFMCMVQSSRQASMLA